MPTVYDSAKNMIKAFKQKLMILCSCHKLNTCLEDAFEKKSLLKF